MPHAKITPIDDYVHKTDSFRLFRFSLKKHFAYPLKSHDNIQSNDPAGYIASALSKPKDDEAIVLQIAFRHT